MPFKRDASLTSPRQGTSDEHRDHDTPPPEQQPQQQHNQQHSSASQLSRDALAYTPFYCEENVWRLLQVLLQRQQQHTGTPPAAVADLFAVFISNAQEAVPLWCQRASSDPSGHVLWDYHVIALEVPPSSSAAAPSAEPAAARVHVWDQDLLPHPLLPFPCSLAAYAQHALRAHEGHLLPPQFRRRMRLVPAPALLEHFASDRSHMLRPDGAWDAPPPPQPCISNGRCTMNLERYRDMHADVLQRDAVSGWHDVAAAAQSAGPFGVVVEEETLLECLLPQEPLR